MPRIIGGIQTTAIVRKRAADGAQLRSPAPAPAPAPAPSLAHAVERVRIDERAEGQRLDNFLLGHWKGVPKTHVYRVIRSGEVRVNRGRALADTRLAIGDELRLPPVRRASHTDQDALSAPPPREFPIVWEDDALIAIDKPAGVAVHGGSGVAFGVIEQLRRARPDARFLELVHRLDRETSGLLLLAKKRSALVALQDQFRRRETGKTYAALVVGAWPKTVKVIDLALHKTQDAAGERHVRVVGADHAAGRRSISLVRLVQAWTDWSLLDVAIKTGRTHQIRVHLAHLGHPIAGDPKYGDFERNRLLARGKALAGQRFGRMFLHARCLRFTHPASGEAIELDAPLPAEFGALIAALDAQTGARVPR